MGDHGHQAARAVPRLRAARPAAATWMSESKPVFAGGGRCAASGGHDAGDSLQDPQTRTVSADAVGGPACCTVEHVAGASLH